MKIDLWPTSNISDFQILEEGKKIESFFSKYFYPFKVSYVSKARVAIKLILEYENIGRNKNIFVQPYSSHCIFDSVGKYACPNIIDTHISDYDIIYHQWGHKNKINITDRKNVLIEDSVDSLFLDISKQSIFPNNGKYAIVSLPKLIPVPFGGLIIFKNDEDKVEFDNMIEPYPKITDEYKKLKLKYLNLNTQIDYLFPTCSYSVDKLEKLILLAKEQISKNIDTLTKITDLSQFDFSERLPSNIYFPKELNIYNRIKFNSDVLYKSRMYYDYNKKKSKAVDLVPVHYDAVIKENK